MTSTLLSIGAFGLLGISILCPLLAWPAYWFQRRFSRTPRADLAGGPAAPSVIEIIIPAHNEDQRLSGTLAAIQRSLRHFQDAAETSTRFIIHVGADGCTDNTVAIAKAISDVAVTEFPEPQGKWNVIKTLVAATPADWVILVDAGTLWPENFVTDFMRALENEPHAIAVAPAYSPQGAGPFTRMVWQIEVFFKRLETCCGGPVSLHGATVGYQTGPLRKVYAQLGEAAWLNDDIVIPLMLRTLYPEGVIVYPAGVIQDAGGNHDRLDLGRRKRMLAGNLQWAGALLPNGFRLNPIAGLVAIRRLFRLFWAYWVVCAAVGFALMFHSLILPGVLALGLLIAFSGSFRQFLGAAWVSLSAPYRIARSDWAMEVSWE